MPKDEGHLSVGDETFTQTHYTKTQEYIIYACMIGVTVVMIFDLGGFLYLAPAVAIAILIWTGVLDAQEASRLMLCDTIWMMAGVLVVSDALGTSGVSELVGNLLLSVLGKGLQSLHRLPRLLRGDDHPHQLPVQLRHAGRAHPRGRLPRPGRWLGSARSRPDRRYRQHGRRRVAFGFRRGGGGICRRWLQPRQGAQIYLALHLGIHLGLRDIGNAAISAISR